MRIKLGVNLTLAEIARAVDAKHLSAEKIEYIATDSREVMPGDLFVAIKGENQDGEGFVPEAEARGGIPFCVGKTKTGICVSNVTDALLMLASYYKKKLTKLEHTVAITGSVGKTTTKEFLKEISSVKYKTHATKGNMNNLLGMPLTLLCAPRDTQVLILEMGMNHSGEISKMSKCVQPNIALITNIGTSHIGNLGSRENIAKAKLEIKDGMKNGRLIIPYAEELVKDVRNAESFSANNISADYYVKKISKSRVEIYEKRGEILSSDFTYAQEHLLSCLACAVAASRKIELSSDDVIRGISSISEHNIRQNIVRTKKIYFLEDCYNASFESVIAAISVMEGLEGYERKSLMLGDILELGTFSEELHRRIGERISPSVFTNLFLYGSHARYIMLGALENGFPINRIFCNLSDNINYSARKILDSSVDGEIILLKASRKMKLERIIDIINSKI